MRLEESENIITDRNIRDKCVKHYDVLDKVKELLLLPGTDLMSISQVAAYYEVSVDHIKALYGSNKPEIDSDGTKMLPRGFYDGSGIKNTSVKEQTKVTYIFDNGQIVSINNRGLKAFSRRAVLRIGMMLQQSNVAKEVRTQLLNIEEKTTEDIKIADITKEQQLALELGMAMVSGNTTAITLATGKMMDFKNRHINKLQQDNKALAGEILEWKDRNKLNAGVRKLAAVMHIPFKDIWTSLYKNLQYKYGIDLKSRNGGKKPYIANVKEEEWDKVLMIFSAMCEYYDKSPTEMFQQTLKV